jgi:hypothetical protein
MSRRKRKRYRQAVAQAEKRGDRGDLDTPPREPFPSGVLGGGPPRPGKANLRLLLRAIRNGWDLSAEQCRALVEHLEGVLRSGRARDELAAVGCIIACARANQDRRRRLAAEVRLRLLAEETADGPAGPASG